MPLNEKTKEFIESVSSIEAKQMFEMDIGEYRETWNGFINMSGTPADIPNRVEEISINDEITLPIRIYTPDLGLDAYPTLFYYPGGGFVAGHIDACHTACSRLAELSGCQVIKVHSRLAPEFKFPHGLNDSYEITKQLLDRASDYKIDTDKIYVGGDSSGGNFAACIAIRAHREPLVPSIKMQLLISPVVDLSHSIRGFEEYEAEDVLMAPGLIPYVCDRYIPAEVDPKDPAMSPYFDSDLEGIAPAVIIVAEYDRFRGDAEIYAQKLSEENVPCDKVVCAGQLHAFLTLRGILSEGDDPVEIAAERLRRQVREQLFPIESQAYELEC